MIVVGWVLFLVFGYSRFGGNSGNIIDEYWLAVNISLDTLLGIGFWFGLDYLMPKWEAYSLRTLHWAEKQATFWKTHVFIYEHRRKKGNDPRPFFMRLANMYAVNAWLLYAFVKIMVWFGVIGILLTLVLSKGFIDPLSLHGIYYDFLFARASDTPNGAHIWSYIVVPLTVIFVGYKMFPQKFGSLNYVGDIYQGLGVGVFVLAVHEGLWLVFYYGIYAKYLTFADFNNVLRDVSFAGMLVMFAVAWWKYPNRTIPMKVFVIPTLIYFAFLLGWAAFGLPITTINNPTFVNNFYQETIWYANPWVNLTEIGGWLLLAFGFMASISQWRKLQPTLPLYLIPPIEPAKIEGMVP